MSHTCSMGKKAAVMSSADGKLYYALYEQTRESNLHLSRPTWECIAFGTAKDCMEKVVGASAFCESEMLVDLNGGGIKPEDYIQQWRDAMKMPTELSQKTAIVRVACDDDGIDSRRHQDIMKALARHGILAEGYEQVEIDVRKDPDLLASLILIDGRAWNYLSAAGVVHSRPCGWGGYAPEKTEANDTVLEVFYLPSKNVDDNCCHWVCIDGEIQPAGWGHTVTSNLILKYAVEQEALYPGSAEDAIRRVREAVEMKGSLPLEQNIVINPGQIYEKWQKLYFVRAAEAALDGGIDPEKKAAYCEADGFSDALPVMDVSLERLVAHRGDKYIHCIPIQAIHFPFLRGAESRPVDGDPSNTP